MAVAVGVLGFQVSLILLTWFVAGLFSSDRKLALALVPPAQGWGVIGWALVPLFAFTLLWTGAVLLWDPSVVVKDLRPFEEMLRGDAVWLVLLVMAVGAPISEELMFRGFLFSALEQVAAGIYRNSDHYRGPVEHHSLRVLAVRPRGDIRHRALLRVALGAHGERVGHHHLPRHL